MLSTKELTCGYCERELTDCYKFSYGLPGVEQSVACTRPDCEPYQSLRRFVIGPFTFHSRRNKGGLLLIGYFTDARLPILEETIELKVSPEWYAREWANRQLDKWRERINA